MIRFRFSVTYEDGTKATVTTRPATDVAYHRKFGESLNAVFSGIHLTPGDNDPTSLGLEILGRIDPEKLWYAAWHASRATAEFDAWLDTVAAIDFEPDADVDPTPPAPPATS